MSTQKGNSRRTRSQKHHNSTAFKNSLHDTNKRTKMINSLEVEGCCERCTEIIQWKIKYKKYKPLTIPKKCIKCSQKAVKRAYCIVCYPCALHLNICTKCGQNKEIVQPIGISEEEQRKQKAQLKQELMLLPERKRRTLLRMQEGKSTEEDEQIAKGDADDSDDPSELSDYTPSETSEPEVTSCEPSSTRDSPVDKHRILPNTTDKLSSHSSLSTHVSDADPTNLVDEVSKVDLSDDV